MVGFVDAHRDVYGVEPISRELPIAPSTYFRHKAQHADPARRCGRAQRDADLRMASASRQSRSPANRPAACAPGRTHDP